ncbi:DUF397 domain-containing protein [Nocardia jiangxiensis]|uniref:DUF397 domain-containing protein n=1 Tax=Nocardia jiangxiensis TaxID=282685 RepID=UPI000A05315C|nr:DUF397 domain-containing protein [Nocardia jiangxiensis]
MTNSRVGWFKSSYSQQGGECVEVAFFLSDTVAVRDSKNPSGPALSFTSSEWDAFTTNLRSGAFADPA